MRKPKWLKFASLFSIPLMIVACKSDNPDQDDPNLNGNLPKLIPAQITSPMNGDTFFVGEVVDISISVNTPDQVKDLKIEVADTIYDGSLTPVSQTVSITTDNGKMGRIQVLLSYTDGEGKRRSDSREIIFFSDTNPEYRIAEIKNTYPHAATSYTQGLEFYRGALFEGTGQYNQSILTEVDLISGIKKREHALDGSIFGEGITILNDTIYQITYKSQICYVYDMDFNLLKTFNYDGEGWGLTNNGKQLIMSNGSDKIVWRNTNNFQIEKTITVCDHETSVASLNELELINGDIYANIYMEKKLVQFDSTSGKVISYIDCGRVYNDAYQPGMDVLNGIAYNPLTEKIYLTGKWWSKLYEVEFK